MHMLPGEDINDQAGYGKQLMVNLSKEMAQNASLLSLQLLVRIHLRHWHSTNRIVRRQMIRT